ncbi:VOC family protein [Propionivibrio dicarboxylicus]|uniref:4-hydroxyphenylpyruvate dioxygenase n=1 Tax=Propionivibrio dicarboxylicus TaxID=83767 RepID=A0A1G8G3Y3_9RHOO|nr:VOC family protein [Propionivibrio dicarboxylicus]SDH89079.1 4-hydroxyphenylpyruvate dioxygenase [Propionivibrio dicarboxylicus]
MEHHADHESIPELINPIGMDGIEFIEFTTSRPQALGEVLERMGFRPVARHRSREVELYRQGSMNIVINSQPADLPRTVSPVEHPIISAMAFRVRDAEAAFQRAKDLGCWDVPPRAQALELNIPGIHGVGESLIYFVDRYDEFSIFDIDFRTIPGVERHPPAINNLSFFGVVQYVGVERAEDWVEFYRQIFGFTRIPDNVRYGIMPRGVLLQSPCRSFFLQLIEPEGAAQFAAMEENLQRIGLGTPDVFGTAAELEKRGIEFLSTERVRTTERGALTTALLGGVMFELVHTSPDTQATKS